MNRKECRSFWQATNRGISSVLVSVLSVSLFGALVSGQELVLVSKAVPVGDSTTASGGSWLEALSADGRFAVFYSSAGNLIPGQTDARGTGDIFMFDSVTGSTTLVSHASDDPTTAGNMSSFLLEVAFDDHGRFVAFASSATNLVPGQVDTGREGDIFLFDRLNGAITLVSGSFGDPAIVANGESYHPAISGDGRFVAFHSRASDLLPGQRDTHSSFDVFLWDRDTRTTVLVSRSTASATTTGDSESADPLLSFDGSKVAFLSHASDLVVGFQDRNGENAWDLFLFDRQTASVSLVSHTVGSSVMASDGFSGRPSLSGDGRYVAFDSTATDLVAGQVNARPGTNVFLYDSLSGDSRLVSHTASSEVTTAWPYSFRAAISQDGSTVAFESTAPDIVPGIKDGRFFASTDVFVYDVVTGTTSLISRSASDPDIAAADPSSEAKISRDGRFVAFLSEADDLVPDQVDRFFTLDVFVHDRDSNRTMLASRIPGSVAEAAQFSRHPILSQNGAVIGFSSSSEVLVPDDRNSNRDAFLVITPLFADGFESGDTSSWAPPP